MTERVRLGNLGAMIASRARRRILITLGVVLLLGVCLKNAWVADDAYISARALDQLAAGHGPNWNSHQRTQVYTSVAWFWLQAPLRTVTADFHTTVLALSLACMVWLLVELRRLVPETHAWLLLILLLVGARGFMDYTTSGLETPLLLLACAYLTRQYLAAGGYPPGDDRAAGPVRRFLLGAGLALLIRHDLLLLWIVPVIHTIRRYRPQRSRVGWARLVALATAPVLVWSVIATVYYGTPLPNPAVTRLHAAIAGGEAARQGLFYLMSAGRDPVLALTLAAGMCVALFRSTTRPLAIGIALHLAYLVAIGGDFMQGRFLAGGFLVAAIVLVRRLEPPRLRLAVAVTAVAGAVLWPRSPLTTGTRYHHDAYFHGIADERGIYFTATSVWTRVRVAPEAFPDHPWADQARRDRAAGVGVSLLGTGIYGHTVGTDVIVVDHLGVMDPFLARVRPAPSPGPFRPGHAVRTVPEGYLESLELGGNRLMDRGLRELYADVSLATTGPLMSPPRARAILRLLARDLAAIH